MNSDAAILFFHRPEAAERFAKNIDQKGVIPFLNRRTRNLLQQTNIPVFEHLDDARDGDSINYRFYLAVQSLFDRGYKRVIAVGNDCPQLQSSDIEKASDLLKTHDLVIGPDLRGGAFLIGISQKTFSRKWAMSLPWHTTRFAKVAAEGVEKITYLEALSDFNSSKELVWIQKIGFRKHLLRSFLQLFWITKSIIYSEREISFSLSGTKLLRAPPLG